MVSLGLVTVLLVQQQLLGPVPTAVALANDTGGLRHSGGRVPPVAWAVRAHGGTVRVDGRLDDAVWTLVEPITQFTQRAPDEGQPASESTHVRVCFDDHAIYVGARLFDAEPGRIAALLGRRDVGSPSDIFAVSIDSYHDHRTSFEFQVNPLGVKYDGVCTQDGASCDFSPDPVWDVATRRDSLGWTVEMRIPLSQLRFPNDPVQTWGLNLWRLVNRRAELSSWGWKARTEEGYSSVFGHVFGLAAIPQPRRLEILPYVAGIEERVDPGPPGNPFNDGSRQIARAGLDLGYGVTSNLTLNATVNPDFGQVEADPAVVNLTALETFFRERRPFFLEGADIFGFGGAQFFHSRRIGRAPQGSADSRSGFVDQPTNTTILGAGKLSGRTRGGWSLGLLDAVTAREFATVDSAGIRFRDEVEPLTNYAVVRARRDFRQGSSTVGFIGTAVNRRIDDERLASLRSAAYAGGVDLNHRFLQNRYRLYGSAGYSVIRGDTLAIQLAQRSSARYYQRPDADHVAYDPTRTSLLGWTGSLGFAKEQGDWTYSISGSAVSPGFELNDVGFQTSADDLTLGASVSRRWTRPGRVFRTASASVAGSGIWNFGGVRTDSRLSLSGSAEFLNFWSANAYLGLRTRSLSDDLTWGGPLAVMPVGWSVYIGVATDNRKSWLARVSSTYSGSALGGWNANTLLSLEWRPTSTVSLSFGPAHAVGRSVQLYVTSFADATATATYGRGYVFAEILQHSLDLTTRVDLTLSPTLSLQLFAQPFVATGDYRRFKELAAARTADYHAYGETPGSTITPIDEAGTVIGYEADPDGAAGPRPTTTFANPDFSVRSLRGIAVLRWEYRPGSTLFLVWSSSCSASESDPRFGGMSDLRRLCRGHTDNVFAVKASYWLNL